jgi:starch phosphorylase
LRENRVHDRHITRRLYASQKHYEEERRMRFEQEILLGIGGVRAIVESGLEPSAYHLNEGHVAFAALEVIRNLIQKQNMSFEEARNHCAQILGFTTHTPVPEGNERFDERLAREYLTPYLDSFLRPHERDFVFNCARNREDMFDMTKLSLLLSGVCRNGVSALHGEVCRKMWGFAWGNFDPEGRGVPIDSITNSVHVPYWQKPVLRKLIQESGGIDQVPSIPDEKIWSLHQEFKTKLIEKVRERVAYQLLHLKTDLQVIYDATHNLLSVDSFMIGFARRFADYKRVTMLLDDEERLFQFLEKAYKKYRKPVHILYAGKPHPNNYSGREKITQILKLSERLESRGKERGFEAQLVFIQGYDIDLARYLEAGVDIWLNNPIRPLEASGTSGMKAGMNGVLNVSVSDGWVPEGIHHGTNGWLFGKGDHESTEQDRAELFKLLEEEILPAYFEVKPGEAFSRKWTGFMKNSIRSITKQFNTDRMLTDYIEKMYLPAVRNSSHAALRSGT